ncbi:MAG: hypothetical protein ABI155_10845 [Paralcaligenes sp.]
MTNNAPSGLEFVDLVEAFRGRRKLAAQQRKLPAAPAEASRIFS